MRTSTRGLALILFASLTLTGCSLSIGEPEETTGGQQQGTENGGDQGAEQSSGAEISGSEYTFNAPEGWGETEYPGSPAPDVFAVDQTGEPPIGNLNVIKSPGGLISIDEVESAGLEELKSLGEDAKAELRDRVTIAGAEAAHIRIEMAQDGSEYALEQFYPSSEDQTYVVTFTFDGGVAESERMQIAESVLATWQWK